MQRKLTIIFPDRRAEEWLTGLVFKPGDRLPRAGVNWTVTSVADAEIDGKGRHMTVTVAGTPRRQVDRKDL